MQPRTAAQQSVTRAGPQSVQFERIKLRAFPIDMTIISTQKTANTNVPMITQQKSIVNQVLEVRFYFIFIDKHNNYLGPALDFEVCASSLPLPPVTV